MSARVIGTMINRINLLPEQFHDRLRELLLSAKFRIYKTITCQIDCLHSDGGLSFEYIAILMNLSKSYVYRNSTQQIQKRIATEHEKAMLSPNSALTINEEHEILKWIKMCHESSNCPSPLDVRVYGAKLQSKRNNIHYNEG